MLVGVVAAGASVGAGCRCWLSVLLTAASPQMTQQPDWLSANYPRLNPATAANNNTAPPLTPPTHAAAPATLSRLWAQYPTVRGSWRGGGAAQTDADMEAQHPERDGRVSRCCRAKEG